MTSFASFEHVLTTRPHDIETLLVSDLHLCPDRPALTQAFLALLDDMLVLPQLKQLYILGDWFEVWIGDDSYLSLDAREQATHWLTPMLSKLKQLRVQGCDIKVMHGNRDFLIRQPFCNLFAGTLIEEPHFITVADSRLRLEHGDALCTEDKRYQRFRKLIRHPLVQWYLLSKPLGKRLAIADTLRQKSQQDNRKKATNSNDIMDVNQQAVCHALKQVDALLHGHTHRPARHQVTCDSCENKGNRDSQKPRYVLGDWRIDCVDASSPRQRVSAVIAVQLRQPKQSVMQPIPQPTQQPASQQPELDEVLRLVEFVWRG